MQGSAGKQNSHQTGIELPATRKHEAPASAQGRDEVQEESAPCVSTGTGSRGKPEPEPPTQKTQEGGTRTSQPHCTRSWRGPRPPWPPDRQALLCPGVCVPNTPCGQGPLVYASKETGTSYL